MGGTEPEEWRPTERPTGLDGENSRAFEISEKNVNNAGIETLQ